MKNPNALIAMAFVSQNANNPYSVFCEYIKYCIFSTPADVMSISDIREAVSNEFGLYLPYNIAVKCLSIIAEEKTIKLSNHEIKRIGTFDINAFDRERDAYRQTETALIQELINYVAKYNLTWSFDYAREQLIKVLDKNGLAYDIFVHSKPAGGDDVQLTISDSELDEFLPDEDALDPEDVTSQPLYPDSLFAGKFIEQTLSGDTAFKDYLLKVCEGLMLCVGAYQLPSAEAVTAAPQIKNTSFFFDTRLLLRFVGCAGIAAVEGAKELVKLIQSNGGNIYYYPQTLDEIDLAFDDAISSLSHNSPPHDAEMRLYATQIKNSTAILRTKRANLRDELAKANIHLRPHESFTSSNQLQFGFDMADFQQFMAQNLGWDAKTIENDAFSIWETHMRRQGNYSEYCGSQSQLPVFVTTNSRLMGIALAYRDARKSCKGIHGWKQNRLPVITDIRLTCRLWSPSEQGARLSLLHLTANAVAAKRPTRRYLNAVKELAIELEEAIPEYSGIPLPTFFEDNVTDALLEQTLGAEENFNLGALASSIAELTDWKAREQEKITDSMRAERDQVVAELNQQTKNIISSAVDSCKNKLGPIRIMLYLILWWPATIGLLFTGICSLLSWVIGSWHVFWIVTIPVAAKLLELLFSSVLLEKTILKWYLPKAEDSFRKKIVQHLRPSEMPYQDQIIQMVQAQTPLWLKCKNLLNR